MLLAETKLYPSRILSLDGNAFLTPCSSHLTGQTFIGQVDWICKHWPTWGVILGKSETGRKQRRCSDSCSTRYIGCWILPGVGFCRPILYITATKTVAAPSTNSAPQAC